MGLQGKHAKDPCAEDCDVAKWFTWVETCPWVSMFPVPPSRHGKSPAVSSARPRWKSQCPSSCLTLKLSPSEPAQSAVGPRSCLTHVAVCSQARENTPVHSASAWLGWGWGERECVPLCSPGIVSLGLGQTSCFFKITSEVPKLPLALINPYPLDVLTGLYGPAHCSVPPNNLVLEGEGRSVDPLGGAQCCDPWGMKL